jgi:hypothetical protein
MNCLRLLDGGQHQVKRLQAKKEKRQISAALRLELFWIKAAFFNFWLKPPSPSMPSG